MGVESGYNNSRYWTAQSFVGGVWGQTRRGAVAQTSVESQHAGMASNPVLLQLSLVFITILSAEGMPSPTTSGISIDIAFYFCLLELAFSIT